MAPRINHASVYAIDPKAAAEHLVALVGGNIQAFHPLEGGWAALFEGSWTGTFLELYPKTHRIFHDGSKVGFTELEEPARGAGTHFNISVDKSRAEIEAICKERGLACTWRDWAKFLDVRIDDDLIVEIVCQKP
jgi:hypothetical protein